MTDDQCNPDHGLVCMVETDEESAVCEPDPSLDPEMCLGAMGDFDGDPSSCPTQDGCLYTPAGVVEREVCRDRCMPEWNACAGDAEIGRAHV